MSGEQRPFDTSTPAVVLKLVPNVMHHGGLGIIRSLGQAGIPVYGVHERFYAPVAMSRYLAGRFIWGPDPADIDQVTAGLKVIAERIGRPAVLFPTDDIGAIYLAQHGSRTASLLPVSGATSRPSAPACRQVLACTNCVANWGSRARSICVPDSLGEARDFAISAGYPVIVKLTAAMANARHDSKHFHHTRPRRVDCHIQLLCRASALG